MGTAARKERGENGVGLHAAAAGVGPATHARGGPAHVERTARRTLYRLRGVPRRQEADHHDPHVRPRHRRLRRTAPPYRPVRRVMRRETAQTAKPLRGDQRLPAYQPPQRVSAAALRKPAGEIIRSDRQHAGAEIACGAAAAPDFQAGLCLQTSRSNTLGPAAEKRHPGRSVR